MRTGLFIFLLLTAAPMYAMKCSACDKDDQKGNIARLVATLVGLGSGGYIINNGAIPPSFFFKHAFTSNEIISLAVVGGTITAMPTYYLGQSIADYYNSKPWKTKCIQCHKSPSDKFIEGIAWFSFIGFLYTTVHFYGKAPAKEAPLVFTSGVLASIVGATYGIPSLLRMFKL